MFQLAFSIFNPFKDNTITPTYSKVVSLTEQITLEINTHKSSVLIAGDLIATADGDHQGIYASLGLLGYEIELAIYGPHAD